MTEARGYVWRRGSECGEAHVVGIAATDTRAIWGQRPAHHCGEHEYLRVESAGFELARNVELNGLTLGGGGAATAVRLFEAV